jgi:hypothetical protein
MTTILSYVGDAIWVLVMAFIASGARAVMQRIPPNARVPLRLSATGFDIRTPRNIAIGVVVGMPFVLGLFLLYVSRTYAVTLQDGLIMLLIRLTVAPLCAMGFLAWLRQAMETLEREGALRS